VFVPPTTLPFLSVQCAVLERKGCRGLAACGICLRQMGVMHRRRITFQLDALPLTIGCFSAGRRQFPPRDWLFLAH
jgi:hypothetical protein